MEIEEKPYIGFPLGLALLVSLLFFIGCFFCCCLHWDKLQCLFPSFLVNVINPQIQSHIQQQPEYGSSHHKPGFPVLMMKENHVQSFPVVMPGDKVPKFIALACPCDPPKDENITIHVLNE